MVREDSSIEGIDLALTGEAAGPLRVSEAEVRRMCASGEIRGAVRIGRTWRFPRSEIARIAREGTR